MNRRLIDTGPLVAYIDADDPAHAVAVASLDDYTGLLFTTSAVLTEALHFVAPDLDAPQTLVEFLVTTGTRIADLTAPADLQEAVALMLKYRDTPMDYADATLVVLANRLELTDVFTLDRRGFATYRSAAGKPFRIFPGELRRRR